jgi:predicted ATP-binding protein involved in virulence
LIDILYRLLQATGSIAIIATHSSYVVREVTRESVKVMSLEERALSIDTPRMQTFGASIDTISQFVFGDTDIKHRYQERLELWAREMGREMTIGDHCEVRELT